MVQDVNLDRNRPQDLMTLPTVGQDTLLDDIFDHQGWSDRLAIGSLLLGMFDDTICTRASGGVDDKRFEVTMMSDGRVGARIDGLSNDPIVNETAGTREA